MYIFGDNSWVKFDDRQKLDTEFIDTSLQGLT
jgi:hypothetical protein